MAGNFYDLLGVPRDASDDDLRKAFRAQARELHPDKNIGLPEDEVHERNEKMKDMSEAYHTLTDEEKRKAYDEELRRQDREGRQVASEGSTAPRSGRTASTIDLKKYNEIWKSIFENMMLGANKEILFGTRSSVIKEDQILISKADMGLLVALTESYKAKEDGNWRVRKSKDDMRIWMPDEVYSVRRENGEVSVFRRVVDWRKHDHERKDVLRIMEEGKPLVTEQVKDHDAFLGEYYFKEEGSERLENGKLIPKGYDRYVGTLKSLAYKLTSDSKDFDIEAEVSVINDYNSPRSDTRPEGSIAQTLIQKDKETLMQVSYSNFWDRFYEAEGQVRKIEINKTGKEGQSHHSPEAQRVNSGEQESG